MAPPFREEPPLCDFNRNDLPRPSESRSCSHKFPLQLLPASRSVSSPTACARCALLHPVGWPEDSAAEALPGTVKSTGVAHFVEAALTTRGAWYYKQRIDSKPIAHSAL